MRSGAGARYRAQLALDVTQNVARAIAAAAATGAYAEFERQFVNRADAIAGALTHSFFGHGVADADVQRSS